MRDFIRTSGGRLLSVATAVALLGGGAAALLGQPAATWVIALFVPVVIALGFVGVAYASLEHWGIAIGAALSLPWVLFLYAVGLGVVVNYAPAAGYALGALGAGALAFALRPGERAAEGHVDQDAGALHTASARGR